MRRPGAALILACLGAVPLRAAGRAAPREIPLRLEPSARKFAGGKVFMDCAFDGAPTTCRLDTGAGAKILVAAGSGFEGYPALSTGSDVNALGRRDPADFIRVGALRLGAVALGPARVRRLKSGRSRPPLVGPQAVTAGAFALRFDGRPRLVLDAPAPPGPLEPLLPFDRDRHLFVRASVGSNEVPAVFDTGCGLTEVDAAYAAAHPDEFSFHGEFMRSPGQPDAKLYKLRSLTLGGRRFEDLDVMAHDFSLYRKKSGKPELSLMVGCDLITRADWYFDLAGRRWALYPARRGQDPARGPR